MKLTQSYSHRFGLEAVSAAGVYTEVLSAIDIADVSVTAKAGKQIKVAIMSRLKHAGWAADPLVSAGFKLDVNALKMRICLTIQTGNIARAFYDLLKFEALHKNGRVSGGVLVVPTKSAAIIIGSNIASFARVREELGLFEHVITVPLLLLAFE